MSADLEETSIEPTLPTAELDEQPQDDEIASPPTPTPTPISTPPTPTPTPSTPPTTTAAALKKGVLSAPGSRNTSTNSGNTNSGGGLHSVKLTIDSNANAALQQLVDGGSGLVALRVSDDATSIGVANTFDSNSDIAHVASVIDSREPRFYVFGRANVVYFLMVIPSQSVRKLRMVYSTAKSSTADAVKAAVSPRLRLHPKLLEWDSDDVSEFLKAPEAFFKAATASAPPPGVARNSSAPAAREVNSSAKNVVSSVHPVFQLLNNNNNSAAGGGTGGPSTKVGKKVIIPPRSAW
jgi:hypothetical protein